MVTAGWRRGYSPSEAHKLESLRRELLDLFESWGYELVIPPLIEFLDSLLVGASEDLDLTRSKSPIRSAVK